MSTQVAKLIEIDERRGVEINFYNGEFYLTSCFDGYRSYCRWQIGLDQFDVKARPMSVRLGNRARAESVLRQVLSEIANGTFK
jgi:hypothetical protein